MFSNKIIGKIFLFVIIINICLVLLGKLFIPETNLLGIAGDCLILSIYGIVGYSVFPKNQDKVLRLAGLFGLICGVIFAAEILLEYAILPKDNTSWGLIEFGSVFALYLLASVISTYKNKSIKCGIITAVESALISSIMWMLFVFLTFYLFRGTARQEYVFRIEGNYDDFAHSGMTNFNTFIMEDFLGAGFFHLLIGPIIAALLGVIGGAIGKIILRIKHK